MIDLLLIWEAIYLVHGSINQQPRATINFVERRRDKGKTCKPGFHQTESKCTETPMIDLFGQKQKYCQARDVFYKFNQSSVDQKSLASLAAAVLVAAEDALVETKLGPVSLFVWLVG